MTVGVWQSKYQEIQRLRTVWRTVVQLRHWAESKLTEEAEFLRGLFLELERIYNHVGDTAALAHDVALDLIASELMVIREELVRLNASITGHRYLCGLNRPGGIVLPQPLDTDRIWTILFFLLGALYCLGRSASQHVEFFAIVRSRRGF
jgi:NADH:ubiquinone oxidoreductase subunit D